MCGKSLAVLIFFVTAGVTIHRVSALELAVESNGGNIFFRSGQDEARQLTTSGRDSSPVLSPDGGSVVFVRALPGKVIGTGMGDSGAEELWLVKTSGGEPTLLVASREDEDMRKVIANFENVRFSSDGRFVFFITPAYVTSGAVHVVDTTNRKERFVLAGNGLEVIRSGEYRDCLLVGQHRYFIGGGSYDWIWLFRQDGTEIGPVGENAENFKELCDPDAKKVRESP